MKPALSFVGTPSFPRLSVKPLASWKASSEVVMQRTISTSFITCAGLKKCRPTKRSGRLVAAACSITGSDDAFNTGLQFAQAQGKLAIPTKDKAGFIVNRLLVPYLLDGMRAYEEGVGTITEIDEAMKAGAGHPMGPLTLADFVGLDTMGAICEVMFDEFRERRFAKPPTLRKMLAAGWYGRKSGMGFYDYSGDEPAENPGLAR